MGFKKTLLIMLFFISSPLLAFYAYNLYKDYKIEQEYQKSIEPYRKLYEQGLQYIRETERLERKYERMLKADHYGGKTPEETLKLFVEALKKKDYKLAAKYYLPWKQKEAEKDLKDWIENYQKGLEIFLRAYNKHIIVVEDSAVDYIKQVKVFKDSKDKYSYRIVMRKNNINNIWKIETF